MHGVTLFAGPALSVLTVALMEGFAYAVHRGVIHGVGWVRHASHHRPRTGAFEANDLYAGIFACPSILLLLGGLQLGWWSGCTWIGAVSPPMARSIWGSATGSSIAACRTAMSRDRAT